METRLNQKIPPRMNVIFVIDVETNSIWQISKYKIDHTGRGYI